MITTQTNKQINKQTGGRQTNKKSEKQKTETDYATS